MKCIFQRKKDLGLHEVLYSLKNFDVQIFGRIIDLLQRDKISDSLGFLSEYQNQQPQEVYIFQKANLQQSDKQWKLDTVKIHIIKTINILKYISNHDFNINDYSTEIYEETKHELIKKIKNEEQIIEFLKFIVRLTSIDEKFVCSGSNSLNLLVQMKVDLRNQNLENIKIQNISLAGANFVRWNLSGSQFENVDISGMNLNGAILLNCKWKKMKIHELNKLDGHSDRVNSVCFSPDGTTLASGSEESSRSNDNSIRLWDVKTGQQKSKLDYHKVLFSQYVFLLMGLCSHLEVKIKISVYGMLKQDNKNQNQMVIQVMLCQSVSLLMVIHQHLVVLIGCVQQCCRISMFLT